MAIVEPEGFLWTELTSDEPFPSLGNVTLFQILDVVLIPLMLIPQEWEYEGLGIDRSFGLVTRELVDVSKFGLYRQSSSTRYGVDRH